MNIVKKNISEHRFKIYMLKQVETSKKLPETKGIFVIWIDIDCKEGRQIYDSI
jgi:hypothetical protein